MKGQGLEGGEGVRHVKPLFQPWHDATAQCIAIGSADRNQATTAALSGAKDQSDLLFFMVAEHLADQVSP